MRSYNFLVCGPKFTKFFSPNRDEMLLIQYFSDFRYVDPFRRYLRSNSKVVTNRAKLWKFSPSQILQGHPLQTQCPRYHPGYEPHPVVKFREVMPTTPKVIGAHMWNFKPNFKCSPLKFSGGTPDTVYGVRQQALVSVQRVQKFEGPAPPRGRNIVF